MATNIYLFNGQLLTTIADGTIDTTHSSLQLPGKGYQNYGEPVIQDILWAATNFAGPSQPNLPIAGQTWYNTNTNVLEVYTGSSWISTGGVLVAATKPVSGSNVGAFWYDSVNLQLYVWDGLQWDLVGPLGSAINSDPVSNSIIPTFSQLDSVRLSDGTNLHQAWRTIIGGIVTVIISKDAAYAPNPPITGFTNINPGINFNNTLSGITISGDPTLFKSNLNNLPVIDNTYNLGSISNRFASIFSLNSTVSSELAVGGATTGTGFSLNVTGSSYLNGPVSIAAGTAELPPIQLTAGVLTTAPTSGALEFDGNNLWISLTQNSIFGRYELLTSSSTVVISGSGNPSNSLGINGQFYIDAVSGNIWGPKASGVWPSTPAYSTAGDMLSGVGAPGSSIGIVGQFYTDSTSGAIYGPKTLSGWGGIDFAPQNSQSPIVISGSGNPSNSIGNNGQYYIDSTSGNVWGPNVSGVWPVSPAYSTAGDMLSGLGAPSSSLGINGQYYIDTTTGSTYGPKTAGAWGPIVFTPQASFTPETNLVVSGSGNPISSLGLNGQYYIDSASGNIWGPKASGAWPGVPAYSTTSDMLSGSGNPSNTLGINGQYYTDSTSGAIWGPKASGAWPGSPDFTPLNGAASIVIVGTGSPTTGFGINGQFYIDQTTGNIWGPKASGAWPAAPVYWGINPTIAVNATTTLTSYNQLVIIGPSGSGTDLNMYIASATSASGLYYTLVNETSVIQNIYCVGSTSSPVTNQFINQSYNYAVSTNLVMFPGQTWELISDGANWNAIPSNQRIILSADTTFYVSTSGTDILSNGTSAATPWATPQFAVDTLQNYYDLGGYTVTIQLADGTYNVSNGNVINLLGQIPGQTGAASLIINGNSTTPTNVVLVASGQGHGLSAHQNAFCTIQNMKINANGTSPTPIPGPNDGGCAIWAGDVSKVVFNNIYFGICSASHLTSSGAGFITTALSSGTYSITGSAPIHAASSTNSFMTLYANVDFYNPSINFSSSFLYAEVCSSLVTDLTFTGNIGTASSPFAAACQQSSAISTVGQYPTYPGGSNSPNTSTQHGGYVT